MKLVAIDTAAAACGVAVLDGDRMVCRAEPMARGHAEALIPMVNEIMEQAGLDYAALDAIAVSIGPGAFTGLRIGIAAARGLALAANRPCLGVPTLAALAAAVRRQQAPGTPIVAVLDSKRGDVYAQAFAADGSPYGAAAALPISDLPVLLGVMPGGVVVAGDAAEEAIQSLQRAGLAARCAGEGVAAIVRGVAILAAERWRAGERLTTPPRPLYLRAPAVGPARSGGA